MDQEVQGKLEKLAKILWSEFGMGVVAIEGGKLSVAFQDGEHFLLTVSAVEHENVHRPYYCECPPGHQVVSYEANEGRFAPRCLTCDKEIHPAQMV